MDTRKLVEFLKGTIDPVQRAAAEEQLKQVEKIIGVAPNLLQIVMSNEVDMPVRQAGAIYLKNLIVNSWTEAKEDEEPRFHIHEQDRAILRDQLVDAVVHAPAAIRSQLCVCIGLICKVDFPGRWSSLVDKICIYLESPEVAGWHGALSSLLPLIKCFEYAKGDERSTLDEAMNLLLPKVQSIMANTLMNDTSTASLAMQRLALKSFFSLTQHHLPLQLLPEEKFSQWMEIMRRVLERRNPEFDKHLEDEDDQEEMEQTEWWKTKKWAIRIVLRMFERYGSPGGVTKEYKTFANWYLNTFSFAVLEVIFTIMDSYRKGDFVSKKVLRDGLLYLKNGVSHAHAWKFMRQHARTILTDIIFPLMCHSQVDERLWKDDPVEYVRAKYAEIMEEDSPVSCSEQLLNAMCKKRKGILDPQCLQMITQVLNDPNSTPSHRDGALHMIGVISDILLKKDQFKDQFETVLVQHVFPCVSQPYGFLRARAAWLLSKLSCLKFSREDILQEILRFLVVSILSKDEEMPVKVAAAFALEMFVVDQHRTHAILQPQVRELTVELLQIIRLTENDDLTTVLQKLVCNFVNDVAPIAHEISMHLAHTFQQIMDGASDLDGEKTVVAMGLLNTLETVLVVMEDLPEAVLSLEPILLQVVTYILDKSIMEFYEEAFSIISSLIDKQISPAMWSVFEGTYRVIERDGVEYFVEMMPCLHNYITADTDAFLSDPNRVLAVCNIIKKVLLDDAPGEVLECHAAKLIEVIILQCRERISPSLPGLLQLVLERLARPINTSELRTMCLQVVVAALYVDFPLTAGVISNMDAFVKQLLADTDCFLGLHDRKICVLGLCTLLQTHARPHALEECSKELLPSLILLFDGLKRAYAAKALENAETDSEDEDDDDEDCRALEVEVLDTDEDEIDEDGQQYLEQLEKRISSAKAPFPISTDVQDDEDEYETDDSDSDYSCEETALECFVTPLDKDECSVDEYIIFKDVMLSLQQKDPMFYNTITNALSEEQRKSLEEIFRLADQRKAAAESKEIQKRGGFEFQQQPVPTTFNFGSGLAPSTLR